MGSEATHYEEISGQGLVYKKPNSNSIPIHEFKSGQLKLSPRSIALPKYTLRLNSKTRTI